MNFSLNHLYQKLSEATYDPSLGIKDVVLEEFFVGGKILQQRLLTLDVGKELKPHLHETDDELGMVLTPGVMYFGKGERNEKGEYVVDSEGNIEVRWEEQKQYASGETFTIPAGKAHHFVADAIEAFTLLLTLPKTHITGEDRKYTTHP